MNTKKTLKVDSQIIESELKSENCKGSQCHPQDDRILFSLRLLKEWIFCDSQLNKRKGAKYSRFHKTPLAEHLVPSAFYFSLHFRCCCCYGSSN
jgi:hypothetical protein